MGRQGQLEIIPRMLRNQAADPEKQQLGSETNRSNNFRKTSWRFINQFISFWINKKKSRKNQAIVLNLETIPLIQITRRCF